MTGYSKIEILGLRGFSTREILLLAEPNGKVGSGLTILVGPNNSGKSTIYEAFRALSQTQSPSFTEGRRNKIAGDKIFIKISKSDGKNITLETTSVGGSEAEFKLDGLKKAEVSFFTLPSRRTFSPFFSRSSWDRKTYITGSELPAVRGSQLDNFFRRLFSIQNDQTKFNSILVKVLGYIPDWYIEQADNGQYYLKFNYNGSFHNSDGVGEGLLSIFTIIDTLYDSNPDDVIFIDEPELSLHPTFQKKLIQLLTEFSTDRQIIISTHSPYFISWVALSNGGTIARTVKEADGTKIYQLQTSTISQLCPLLNNLNNPHILGLDAREIFFLDDNVILVEGQEDVVFINKILDLKGVRLNGTFYGWGVGGAGNTDKIANMLVDLGFKKIAVILDNNMSHLIPGLQSQFSNYKFISIPTDDVRDKSPTHAKPAITGLIDISGSRVNPSFEGELGEIFTELNRYLI